MTILDWFLLIILFGFTWFGFWFGFIHTLGALVGTIAGTWVAGRSYIPVYDWLGNWLQAEGGWLKVVVFAVIFIIVNRVIGFVFYILDRTFHFISVIPFLKSINRLGGALFGLIEGALALGLVLYFAGTVNLPSGILQAITDSEVAQNLIAFAGILIPLLPQVLERIQPYVPNINLSA